MSRARYCATRASVALQLSVRTPLAIRSWLIRVNSWPAAPPTGLGTLVAAGADTAPGAGRLAGAAAGGWAATDGGGTSWNLASATAAAASRSGAANPALRMVAITAAVAVCGLWVAPLLGETLPKTVGTASPRISTGGMRASTVQTMVRGIWSFPPVNG